MPTLITLPPPFISTVPLLFKNHSLQAHVASISTASEARDLLEVVGECVDSAAVAPYAYTVTTSSPAFGDLERSDEPSVTSDRSDEGDPGSSSKLLFLLRRYAAVNTLLIVTTTPHNSTLPHASLGVRRYKLIVTAAKEALECLPDVRFPSDGSSAESSTLGTMDDRHLNTFSLSSTLASPPSGPATIGEGGVRQPAPAKRTVVSDVPLPAVRRVEKLGRPNDFRSDLPGGSLPGGSKGGVTGVTEGRGTKVSTLRTRVGMARESERGSERPLSKEVTKTVLGLDWDR